MSIFSLQLNYIVIYYLVLRCGFDFVCAVWRDATYRSSTTFTTSSINSILCPRLRPTITVTQSYGVALSVQPSMCRVSFAFFWIREGELRFLEEKKRSRRGTWPHTMETLKVFCKRCDGVRVVFLPCLYPILPVHLSVWTKYSCSAHRSVVRTLVRSIIS